jgi:tripartite-type tricarboxylate transporter receptor subunit TctC
VFQQTKGLFEAFGARRVIDTPISESGAFGMAIGAAMAGMRPVFEVMFGDFMTLCMDQLVNQAAKVRYVSNGAATVPLVLVVNPKLPVRNLQELREYAKAHPGALNYGSAGNGSTLHLASELLISETGISMKHVPYRGTGPLITDLIGGQVQLAFVSVSQVVPQVNAGTLRALAVSTAVRSSALADVPTMVEAGVPGYSFDAWIALIGPAGLGKPLVNQYAAAVKTAMGSAQAQAAIAGQGLLMLDKGPDEAPAFFQSELIKHQKLVKQSGATLD